jgi:5-methylcytosine-specific restriction endonuclease McrA
VASSNISQQLSFELPDQPFTPDTVDLVPTKTRVRVCQYCKHERPYSEFPLRWSGAYKQRRIRDTTCNQCRFDRDRLYKADPKVKDKLTNYRKNYYSSDPDSQVIRTGNIRARKLGVKGQLTVHEWREVRELYGNRCAYCGISSLNLQIDHLWPLSLAKKGLEVSEFATNDVENIVPACVWCNEAKQHRPFILMLGWKNGLLQ